VLGSAGMPPDVLRGPIRDIRQAGHTAFGVNIIPRFAPPSTSPSTPPKRFLWSFSIGTIPRRQRPRRLSGVCG